ncbi:MAG: hypothetical protein M1835_005475 [Candelina submexicana]|nr:MAG: hypothetical protein M1835_005475 [Candelina submexicana]
MPSSDDFETLFSRDTELGQQCWDLSWFKTDDFLRPRNPDEPDTLAFQVRKTQEHALKLTQAAYALYESHKTCLRTPESALKANDDRWRIRYTVCIQDLVKARFEEFKIFEILRKDIIKAEAYWLDGSWIEGLERRQRWSLVQGWKQRRTESATSESIT